MNRIPPSRASTRFAVATCSKTCSCRKTRTEPIAAIEVTNDIDRLNYNIAVYVSNAKSFPLLSREEERVVAFKVLDGDKNGVKYLREGG